MTMLYFTLLFLLFSSTYCGKITNRVHATPTSSVYIISFSESVKRIFASNSELTSGLTVYLSSSSKVPVTHAAGFLDSSFTVASLSINVDTIPLDSKLIVNFDYTDSSATYYLVNEEITIDLIASEKLSDSVYDRNKLLIDLNMYSNIGWMSLAAIGMFISPYSLIYLNSKILIELLDILKQVNLQYQPFLNDFLAKAGNRVGGIKVPNLFGILLSGDDFNSGYDRIESYYYNTEDRIDDYRITTFPRIHFFNRSVLLLDTYGIQIEMFIIVLFIIIILELLRLIFAKDLPYDAGKINRIRIIFRWNFLLACVLGSYQSAIYYSISQVGAMALSPWTRNATISFITALVVMIGVIIIPIWAWQNVDQIKNGQEKWPKYYEILAGQYKMDEIIYPMNILFLLGRSAFIAIVAVIPGFHPIVQCSLIVAACLAYFLYISISKPFKRTYQTIMQVIWELFMVVYSSVLFVISLKDKTNETGPSDQTARDNLSYILLYMWVGLPFLNTFFAIIEIYCSLFRNRETVGPHPLPQTIHEAIANASINGNYSEEAKPILNPVKVNTKANIDESTMLDQRMTPQQNTKPILNSLNKIESKEPEYVVQLEKQTNKSVNEIKKESFAEQEHELPPYYQDPATLMRRKTIAPLKDSEVVEINNNPTVITPSKINIEAGSREINGEKIQLLGENLQIGTISNLDVPSKTRNTSKSDVNNPKIKDLLSASSKKPSINQSEFSNQNIDTGRSASYRPSLNLNLKPSNKKYIDEAGFNNFKMKITGE